MWGLAAVSHLCSSYDNVEIFHGSTRRVVRRIGDQVVVWTALIFDRATQGCTKAPRTFASGKADIL